MAEEMDMHPPVTPLSGFLEHTRDALTSWLRGNMDTKDEMGEALYADVPKFLSSFFSKEESRQQHAHDLQLLEHQCCERLGMLQDHQCQKPLMSTCLVLNLCPKPSDPPK